MAGVLQKDYSLVETNIILILNLDIFILIKVNFFLLYHCPVVGNLLECPLMWCNAENDYIL
jgi:hypothetical protein